jgi:methionine synthase I (cobalamin-dependent)
MKHKIFVISHMTDGSVDLLLMATASSMALIKVIVYQVRKEVSKDSLVLIIEDGGNPEVLAGLA